MFSAESVTTEGEDEVEVWTLLYGAGEWKAELCSEGEGTVKEGVDVDAELDCNAKDSD